MSNLVVSNLKYPVEKKVEATIAFDSSYPTGGETISATNFGLSVFTQIDVQTTSGYICQPVIAAGGATAKLKMYDVGAVSPTGTAAAQTFTGSQPASAVTISTNVFSGTGQASSGQVITTTDNQTMTLNQCAGMWFVSATHGPYLIASNTAVSGAPAVLTIIGTAPTTDAGAYKILTGPVPSGANSTSAVTGVVQAAAALAEVPNATNLSALSAVVVQVYGD